MVHADAQCRGVGAAQSKQRQEFLAEPVEFGGIFLVGVFDLAECAPGIDEVARIDAHLVGHSGCRHRGLGIEVDVGHERYEQPFGPELLPHRAYVFGFAHSLGGEAHVAGSGLRYGFDLGDRAVGVHGRGRGHGLHPHGIIAAERYAADIDGDCGTAPVIEYAHQLVLKRYSTFLRSALAFTILSTSLLR